MTLGIRGSIVPLTAQRRLGEATDTLSSTRERLSSGSRINRAADDAAGLSVASSLQFNSRISTQAIRNIDDAISLLNVAEGSVTQLSNISLRQQELAQQAATGTYGNAQRKALDAEANALSEEYIRIIESTKYNGRSIFRDQSLTSSRVQAGYGQEGGVAIDLGKGLARPTGNGSFTQVATLSTLVNSVQVAAGDVNRDGHQDVVALSEFFRTMQVFVGDGTGAFTQSGTYDLGVSTGLSLVDLNGDGVLDALGGSSSNSTVRIMLGNSDGSFKAAVSYAITGVSVRPNTHDVNGDGVLDIVAPNYSAGSLGVLLGNSDGTFRAATDCTTVWQPHEVAFGDINEDGAVDLAVACEGGDQLQVMLGNGDGSFKARTLLQMLNVYNVNLVDINNDDHLDLISDGGGFGVRFGNGDGTFKSAVWYPQAQRSEMIAHDVTGDGYTDLMFGTGTLGVSLFIGNSDGSFQAEITSSAFGDVRDIAIADFNEDGVSDVAFGPWGTSIGVSLQNTTTTSTLSLLPSPIDLRSREGAVAALDTIQENLNRVQMELGNMGAIRSRLATAQANLWTQRENTVAAHSRIADADRKRRR